VRCCVRGRVCRLATACQHHRSGPLDARRRILTPFAGVFPLIDRHQFWATRASRGRALPRIPLARAVVVSSPPGLRSLSQLFSHRPQRTTIEPHPDCTVPRSAPVKATPRRGAVRCGSYADNNTTPSRRISQHANDRSFTRCAAGTKRCIATIVSCRTRAASTQLRCEKIALLPMAGPLKGAH
jgi:hypothetical protein